MRRPIKVNRSSKKSVKVSGKTGTSVKRPSKVFNKAAKKSGVTGYTGAAGFQQGQVEKKRGDERARQRNIPWDFYINVPNETEKNAILLDRDAYFMYEHSLQGSDGKWTTERCIRDQGHCPLCSKLGKEGTYVLKLSCIDPTPFTKQDGTRVKASKRIMTVKTQQLPKFERLYQKNGGTFRGIKLNCIRDSKKDARIGNEFEQLAKLSEEKLAKYGKDLIEPLDFSKIYPEVSEKELAQRWDAARALGSSNFDEDDEDDDDAGWGK